MQIEAAQAVVTSNGEPVDVVDSPFFAPASADIFDGLLGEYRLRRAQCEQVAGVAAGELGNVIHYFIEGNAGEDRLHRSIYVDRLFQLNGAVAALNAAYWSKALALTDVYDYMPQARRDEWNNSIREHKTPEFNEEAVRPTILGLLTLRDQFLAERVDGIFRGLSGEHVTNAPEAFGKRMIIARVPSTEFHFVDHRTCGLINDLRCVIAKFMGRDEPKYQSSDALIAALKGHWGEWLTVDGGALRIRLYKKGTAHLEVHPDMAWRLNCILARLYPTAIPSQFRQRPRRVRKEVAVIDQPLPFKVLEVLGQLAPATRRASPDWPERYVRVPNALELRYAERDKNVLAEAEAIIQAVGGVKTPEGWYQFDFPPAQVIARIVVSGCIPDSVSHQFYPTPRKLAAIAADLADIGETDDVLEPEAGQGDLAEFLPKERTTCVEISPLRCDILRARGFTTVKADFLEWSRQQLASGARFTRVVMNPPFADGRAIAHLEQAADLVASGGRIVAILPASLRGKTLLAGFEHEWSARYDNEFPGTSASVAILTARRPL